MKRIDDVFWRIRGKVFSSRGKLAFKAAFLVGMAAHIYMFTNKFPNYDDVNLEGGVGATFRLGRWFLWVLGAIAYHLDLAISIPWINGMVSVLLLAVSAGFMAELFQLKSYVGSVLTGACVVVFPTWTSTFFFMFTAPYYALAVFMMTLAVYLNIRVRKGMIYAVFLIALSLGIYQAYLPFAAVFYVVMLFLMLFDDKTTCKTIMKKAISYLCTLIIGVGIYYAVLKCSLFIRGEELSSYKGVSSFGGLSLKRIPDIIQQIVQNIYGVFTNNNLEISYNLLTKGMYFILFLCVIICAAWMLIHLYREKCYGKFALTLIFLVAFEIAINGIFIMCAEGTYSLMYYSFVFLMLFPLCLLDRCFKMGENKILKCAEGITVLMLVIGIGSYCHYANAEYLSMQLSYQQAVGYFNTLIAQIKSTEGYTDGMAVAFVGTQIEDQSMYRNEAMNRYSMSGREDTLIEAYSRTNFMKYYCGFSPEYVEADGLNRERIEAMPRYPDAGSIQVIDGVVVIKFEEYGQ